MQIFIKLLTLSILLASCSGAYNAKDTKKAARDAENQANRNISDHVGDVGSQAANNAASIPTDISPYVTP